MYYAQGRIPFNVVIWVDDRITPGFDYQWRRSLREIRRINDALSRSGVNTQVYVSAMRYKDMSNLSYSAPDIWGYYSSNEPTAVAYAKLYEADAVLIIRNTEGQDREEYCGAASLGPQDYWLPIMVLTCVYEGVEQGAQFAATAAPHEFGHILGLGHDYADGDALIDHGYGYHSEEGNTNTIMSQAIAIAIIPIFSSPLALWSGRQQGSNTTADATAALNDAAPTAALFYEQKWGDLSGANVRAGEVTTKMVPPPPIGVN